MTIIGQYFKFPMNDIENLYCKFIDTYSKGQGQPGKVANPGRGQLNRENVFFLSPFAPEN